jgi:hypothetical protein
MLCRPGLAGLGAGRHDIKGNDVEQFRTMGTQMLLTPSEYNSGSVVYPYEKAK